MGREADKDVAQFDRWAPDYDRSPMQERLFRPVHERTLTLVDGLGVSPRRVLDVGCGTGSLLTLMKRHYPAATLAGVDPAPGMISVASRSGVPATLARAGAAALPFSDAEFDLVTSTLSFHHWADQRAGVAEVGRVLAPGGVFVLADFHAVGFLRPFFTLARRRHRMHTRREIADMMAAAGLWVQGWAPALDLDPLMRLRTRRSHPATGRPPLITAVIARRADAPGRRA
ncbi:MULTISPECIES: class I SAM-dependent methyltransferase [Frankia]|uniref:class I SAM-dependent methyltransferase n=1 Tax=Frankia TaxID=1854 RepID=UPI000310AA12|nr:MULTISPECIES: class I SAM-dependent methyltransferase [Frankia]